MTTPHYNVLIATPGRSMENEYVKSLIKTVTYLNENNISYLYLNEYSSQVNMAREATTMGSMFLDAFSTKPLSGKVTYDKIFWIDSDISWEIEDFTRLYGSDKDIISGLYFSDRGVPMAELSKELGEVLGKNEITEVGAAGFGFICVKSGVFESIPRPWFDIVMQKIKNDEGQEMLVPFGEDYSWCKKAINYGFKVYLDPSVQLAHHKRTTIALKKVEDDSTNSSL